MSLEGHFCWEDCDEGPHGCVCGNECEMPLHIQERFRAEMAAELLSKDVPIDSHPYGMVLRGISAPRNILSDDELEAIFNDRSKGSPLDRLREVARLSRLPGIVKS